MSGIQLGDSYIDVKNTYGNDQTGLTNAINAAQSYETLVFDRGDYIVTSNLPPITSNILSLNGAVIKSVAPVALQLGSGTQIFDKNYDLPEIRWNTTTWDNSSIGSEIGLKVVNVASSKFTMRGVYNFSTGVLMLGDDGSITDNYIVLGKINNNAIGIHLKSDGTTGYVTQNTFVSGSIIISNDLGDRLSGTRGLYLERAALGVESNSFYKTNFQGKAVEYLLYTSGAVFLNNLRDCYFELPTGDIRGYVHYGDDAWFNHIDEGLYPHQLTITTGANTKNNYVKGQIRNASADSFILSNIDGEIIDDNYGLILNSPDGTRYRIKVDNLGVVSTEEII